MRASIITATLNCKDTIQSCIESIVSQSVPVEHLVIDGGSTDGTLEILAKYGSSITKIVSEADCGVYYAMNKGILLASGDVVGFLHGDDFYAHNRVIEKVLKVFEKCNVDSCYGDLQYVSRNNPAKVIRHWKSTEFNNKKIKWGWMPPHPTFFVKKNIYEKYGAFDTNFSIAADYELILRFLVRHRISTYYIPDVLVKMRIGGKSNRTVKNIAIKTFEDYKALKLHGIKNRFFVILLKNLSKFPQFILKNE